MNRFKAVNGVWFTQSLFYELSNLTDDRRSGVALFTVKDEDKEINGKVFLSARILYLACLDPTGYLFATTHLGGYAHWKKMSKNNFLIPLIDRWNEELEVLLQSNAIQAMIGKANDGDRIAMQWLASKSWIVKKAGAATAKEEQNTDVDDDMDRITSKG